MTIPKHEATARRKKKPPQPPQAPDATTVVVTGPPNPDAPFHAERPMQHEINRVAGLSGIEGALDELAGVVSGYVNRAASDDHNSLAVFTGPEGSGYNPVLLAFQGDTTDRIATALERIADALAKTAGLNLPSLEFPPDDEAG